MFYWSHYFLESRFKVKTIFSGRHLKLRFSCKWCSLNVCLVWPPDFCDHQIFLYLTCRIQVVKYNWLALVCLKHWPHSQKILSPITRLCPLPFPVPLPSSSGYISEFCTWTPSLDTQDKAIPSNVWIPNSSSTLHTTHNTLHHTH